MKAVLSVRFRWICLGFFAVAIFLLYSPLLMLAFESFRSIPKEFGGTREWTLDHYRTLFSQEVWSQWVDPIQLSFGLGIVCAIVSTVFGVIAAFQLEKSKGWMKRIWWAALQVPLVFPEILLALSFLVWFAQMGLPLGTTSILIAHITFSFTFSTLILGARLHQLDPLWREAAQDLGASPFQVFYKIEVPFLMPSLLSSLLMAFSLSWDDFLITFFVAGPQSQTLPMKLYSMLKFGFHPEIVALSTLLVVFNLTLILLAFRGLRFSQKGA